MTSLHEEMPGMFVRTKNICRCRGERAGSRGRTNPLTSDPRLRVRPAPGKQEISAKTMGFRHLTSVQKLRPANFLNQGSATTYFPGAVKLARHVSPNSAGRSVWNLCALFTGLGEPDGDRLLPAFHDATLSAFSRAQCSMFSPAHCAPDSLACGAPISSHSSLQIAKSNKNPSTNDPSNRSCVPR